MCILVVCDRRVSFPHKLLGDMVRANPDGAGIAWFDAVQGRAVRQTFLAKVKPEVPTWTPEDEADELDRYNYQRSLAGKVQIDTLPAKWPRVSWDRWGYEGEGHEVKVDEIEAYLDTIPDDAPMMFHARWCTHGAISRSNCHPFKIARSSVVMAHNGVVPGLTDGRTDEWSDTRVLARETLAGMNYKQIVKASALIDLAGGWSKFAFMNGKTGEIHKVGKFYTFGEVAFSNLGFMPKSVETKGGK